MLPARIKKPGNRSGRWKSQAHCTFVRSHHCVVPSCGGLPIEVAHIRSGSDAGTGRKPSDWYTVSMCQEHHSEQHRIGEVSFQEAHGINLHALADAFAKASPRWPEINRARQELGFYV